MGWYQRHIFPRLLAMASKKMDAERESLLNAARGTVLELGAGTGVNFGFYGAGLHQLWALEPDKTLIGWAQQALARLPENTRQKVQLVQGDGQQLPFASEYFDQVVCCLVLCTVPDPLRVLQEARRVLKPEGELLLFEHVEAEPGSRLAAWQRRLNPFWHRCAGGCQLNRPTLELVRRAGFDTANVRSYRHPEFPALVSPIIFGTAQPR
ncbi:class I SAM-dependent methyltransferase [Marinobacterium jannaschii]|uniref:class I SAM-dependent methyltransferase n=1 Tax=Marinobacterium jannaschii TaxID=64970 RepID=UPI0004801D71|nr:class I SAM-dependent methyltransferase [Marinobacterium jannaschii]